ncbi:isoleucine--tRNA ligase [Spirochaetia bacterium]|nr:isoleucine--tRNA ligase [Spirochaetia bacterium]
MYKPVDPKVNFPELEESILHFWQEQHIFEKSITNREACEEFVFYDGPPFATGLPHFGHFVPSTIKDIIPRYQAMCGKKVERRFGWDCHGLPVENLIEKELGLNSKTDIERYGVTAFNEACRASVLRYVSEWRHVITRLGRWVDFDHDYKTMDPDYMETIWWVIKKLWDSGLLYEGHYILPYCPRCATVLSNHELNLGGYKDVYDPALTIRFKVKGGSLPLATNPVITTGFSATPSAGDTPATPPENTYLLAWTTTPWTLPSNLALAVGPDIDYVMVQDGPDRYILAEARLPAYYKNPADYTIVWRKKGTDLVGMEYEPLFPYFADAPASFRVYPGDFVSTEDGTGIVHTAPGFGEDDQRVLKGTGVPVICPVDAECRFTAEVPDYQGMFVKDADKAIMDRLKAEGKVIRRDQILHAYPHCWRCGHPLIYRAVGSWFVDVQKIKPDMLAANGTITWVPDHIKAGRFGKWLEGARDWAISRNRYWGNPLPIWKCPDCGTMICIGSRQELKEKSGVEAHDLHKHFVDEITIPCECGAAMHRVPEVLDCWFESGAMPYAQNHYPFENKEFFDTHFPADFINEGLDQTRGWFYTLTILAAALFKKPAFQHCIVSGLVLASDGKKMSKSLRNYTDPMEVVNRFGADALRLFLIHSSVVKADDLRYSDEGVRDVLKSIIIPLWNAYSFFVTYANIDKVSPAGAPETPVNPLDQWILSAAETLVERVRSALDSYDLSRAIDPILDYIDFLNNWYIRRSRRRFWRSENDADKVEAYHSLYTALKTLITVAAPFMPFTTDAIWQNLRLDTDPESVHLADFPEVHESRRNPELEYRMEAVQHAVSMGRALRSHYNLKVRQPLQRVELVTRNPEEKAALAGMDDIIREELNVKEVWFRENEEDLVSYEVKANFRVLGKELGKDMKTAAEKIADLSPEQIRQILAGKSVALEVAGSSIELTTEKIDIRRIEKSGFRVLNEGTLTVALDTEITPELAAEGDIRDLIRGLQNLRKESGFAVSDRIHLKVSGSPRLEEAWNRFAGFAAAEVLAVDYVWNPVTESAAVIEAGEETWRVEIERV